MFTIELDSEAFHRDLAHSALAFQQNVHEALDRSAAAASTFAKVSSLYKNRTGGLRESVRLFQMGQWQVDVVAGAKYAGYVENGTMRHFIFPRNRRALRFMWNGRPIFRAWVFHPGTKSRPFMNEARNQAEPLFARLVREATDRAFN